MIKATPFAASLWTGQDDIRDAWAKAERDDRAPFALAKELLCRRVPGSDVYLIGKLVFGFDVKIVSVVHWKPRKRVWPPLAAQHGVGLRPEPFMAEM